MTKTLGERIKELREDNDISQKDFAMKINVSNTTLSMYESNKRVPSDDVKKKIADYFNVSLDYLMGVSDIRIAASKQIQLSAKEIKEKLSYDEFMETAKAFFMDASEEDREAITRDISNLYWESKQINKAKHALRNKKK